MQTLDDERRGKPSSTGPEIGDRADFVSPRRRSLEIALLASRGNLHSRPFDRAIGVRPISGECGSNPVAGRDQTNREFLIAGSATTRTLMSRTDLESSPAETEKRNGRVTDSIRPGERSRPRSPEVIPSFSHHSRTGRSPSRKLNAIAFFTTTASVNGSPDDSRGVSAVDHGQARQLRPTV